MRRPIFLDRDGVINVDIVPYVCRLEDFRLFDWTVEALTLLDRAGFDIFVISNQQGVALGLTPPEVLSQVDAAIQDAIAPYGFQIKSFYYCTAHDGESHPWRKPAPGMILAARDEFGLDLESAFMIGDKDTDMECGIRAGCRPLLVMSGVTPHGGEKWFAHPPERVFESLLEAAVWVTSGA
ncbi:MAG TPA: HAD family hydrolase [Fimbriimonadaceae bacterium]|nr:HAD family hydrolase [Fimbriimonadaceae bacterium]HRJ96420.1 HAD family hydrolase [Fimbriimonadaceae bacterium]